VLSVLKNGRKPKLDLLCLEGVPEIDEFLKMILNTRNMSLEFLKKLLSPQKSRSVEQSGIVERKQLKH